MKPSPWSARVSEVPPGPLEIPSLIWQLLWARGLQSLPQVEGHLKASLKDLRSPFILKGMDQASQRLLTAWQRQEPICIYADFDLDGSSGLALLKTGLERLGFTHVIGYQPRRLAEGYGVHAAAVEEIHKLGVNLMVTVDVGITANPALKLAKTLGLDVIVTDHHLPGAELPPAYTIVNPNQGDCESGLGHLAGVGVAFYLFLAVRASLREQGIPFQDFDPKELLDFFVIGTLTDMVPLVHENRVLVKHGLVQLAQTKRAGLRALLEILELDNRPLTSQDVAIRLAPKLNALSRLESDIRPIDMLLASDLNEARALAREVLACNERRVQTQKQGLELALNQLQGQKPSHCVWVWSKEFHRGVVGLIATRLSQDFGVPAFVGAVGEDNRIVGSARIPKGRSANLVQALETAQNSLGRFGGHAAAAGFELGVEEAQSLGHQLDQYFSTQPACEDRAFWYDAEGTLIEVNTELMKWLENLEPFGSGFETPLFRLRELEIKSFSELRGGHLRLEFTAKGASCQGIFFSPPLSLMDEIRQGARQVQAIGELQWNHFRGRKTLQLDIKDLHCE